MENRSTWLVKIWLQNTREAYDAIRSGYAPSTKNRLPFKEWFYSATHCTDRIEWSFVQWDCIDQCISDLANDR